MIPKQRKNYGKFRNSISGEILFRCLATVKKSSSWNIWRILVLQKYKRLLFNQGKIYSEFKCLNCEFNKRKFEFNWHPLMLPLKNNTKINVREIIQKTRQSSNLYSNSPTNAAQARSLSLNSVPRYNKLNTIVKDNMLAKNIDLQVRTPTADTYINKKTPNDGTNRFEEFDMSFKYDIDAIMKQKAEEHKQEQIELEKTPKLTLYLLWFRFNLWKCNRFFFVFFIFLF